MSNHKTIKVGDYNWTRTYNHLVRKRTLNQWPVWLNSWMFVSELSGCGFESSCSHSNFRFCTYLEQGVSWHSHNYRVWTHSQMRTWHDENIQPIKIGYTVIINIQRYPLSSYWFILIKIYHLCLILYFR